MYRYGGLGDDRPAVHFGTHEVDGAARNPNPVGEDARVRIEALERWQQRWVDVDHPVMPQADKLCRHQAHEARQRNELCVRRQKRLLQFGLEAGA